MASELIVFNTQDGITTLTLNRPEKSNALNGAMIKSLLQALTTLSQDSSSRVLLIQSAGAHFCAGADIAWMKKMAEGSYNDNYEDAQYLADLMYQLYIYPKPTIVLTHGMALGGGMGLIAACDIAIASKNAKFGFSEINIAMSPSTISPYVIATIGERAARYYFLTGEHFGTDEAHRLGLIHQIESEDALLSTGIKLAKRLLEFSQHALMMTKQLIQHVAKEEINTELGQKTAEHLAHGRSSQDAREGLQAFLEKRKPTWR